MLSRHFSKAKYPGLLPREKLLFERSTPGTCGLKFPEIENFQSNLGDLIRKDLDLPSLSEVQVTRHYVRMSRLNYSLDQGTYPLGSCTMKWNPRASEAAIRQTGFTDIHPLQPIKTVQGCLSALNELSDLLLKFTGMNAITLNPAAGAHGELAGIMAISEALIRRGEKEKRNIIIVPDSAHGTNPASSALCGFSTRVVKSSADGTVHPEELKKVLDDKVAGMMLTNPNTCGLFEQNVKELADLLHSNGSYLYFDGANMNALFGRVNIHELGADALHLNIHKSFATPHGGGGPGSGPVLYSERLMKYLPYPTISLNNNNEATLHEEDQGESLGRMKAYHGQFMTLLRALAYVLALGGDGLKQVAADAVMNANYIRVMLKDYIDVAFPDTMCMHEVLFTDKKFTNHGFSTMDVAKAMIDSGYHPPTVYFPLIVTGAMLFEPTETESKAELDEIIQGLKDIIKDAIENPKEIQKAPIAAPIGRPDETLAARKPVLKYVK
ncbi:putative glycine dehydrogenase [decarboxylating] subunit 2 [Tritrichomonas foetus]|uniref:glycine dehydrogenase (aminomethyl-transferring) n=1 Tax=Tritrichomonas foetus TaxID=1144522 RepID=A0A1J4KYP2_9EUKA|nr:putative glycine dehydrogenase [decarboxylating] subunit 2 [Tritrichomonas foetus]|eukprot:OHT16367.1 putative glycine dehydrogenase [decarboxylating] subunit 2 [Tritrichomonas foetus]